MKILLIFLAGFGPFSAMAQNWQEVNGGLEYPADDWVVDTVNNWLYMYGGAKYVQDTLQINGFGRFDGTQWHELPLVDTLCTLYCNRFFGIEYYDGDIFLCHSLDPWGIELSHVGRFDGTTFDYDFALTDGGVGSMEVIDGKLWCIGTFDTIAGQAITNVAIWDGSAWSGLPSTTGFAPTVADIQEYQGDVYVCGNIHNPNNMTEIVVWNGQEWSAVGGGLTNNGWANTMAVYQGELYVGGNFWKDWGAPGDNIAKWNGSEWSEVGGGTGGIGSPNGQVWQLLVHNGLLYAVGQFHYAGGQYGDYIATWDGSEWCTVTDTLDNVINTLIEYDGDLYAGGGFWTINGDSINRFAKWVGGGFGDSCGIVQNAPAQQGGGNLHVYPNPATETLSIDLPPSGNPYRIEIRDVYGRLEVLHPAVRSESGVEVIYTSRFSPGIYFLRVSGDFGQASQKVVIAH